MLPRITPKKKFRRKSASSEDKNCKDEIDRGSSHATTNNSGYMPPNNSHHGPLHTNRQATDELDSHNMPVTNHIASQNIDTSNHNLSQQQQLPPTTPIDYDDDKTIDIRESSSSNDAVMHQNSDVLNSYSPTRTPLPTQQQNNRPRLPSSNSSNIAKETDKDDVDDGAYSQWNFLASISESFDTTALPSPQPGNNNQINITPTKKRSSRSRNQKQGSSSGGSLSVSPHKNGIEVKVSKSGDSDCPMHGNNDTDTDSKMYELPSWNKSSTDTTSQSPTRSHIHTHTSTPMKSSTQKCGREYIEKEQRIRNKWIAKMNDALGGTVNFDNNRNVDDEESLSTMGKYQYVPPKMPMILPTHSRTSDWDMKSMLSNISRKTRSTSEGQIQWTPQDSSYGAAVPAFGFIPKRIRKLLEGVIFVILVCLLLFVVVKVGIMLKISSFDGGQDIEFDDDDHYIANDGEESGDSNDESNDQDQDRFRI